MPGVGFEPTSAGSKPASLTISRPRSLVLGRLVFGRLVQNETPGNKTPSTRHQTPNHQTPNHQQKRPGIAMTPGPVGAYPEDHGVMGADDSRSLARVADTNSPRGS